MLQFNNLVTHELNNWLTRMRSLKQGLVKEVKQQRQLGQKTFVQWWLKILMNEFDDVIFVLLKPQWERLEKFQAWTGIRTLTSVMPVQCSTSWAIKLFPVQASIVQSAFKIF